MKITRTQLRQIIKEELGKLNEGTIGSYFDKVDSYYKKNKEIETQINKLKDELSKSKKENKKIYGKESDKVVTELTKELQNLGHSNTKVFAGFENQGVAINVDNKPFVDLIMFLYAHDRKPMLRFLSPLKFVELKPNTTIKQIAKIISEKINKL